MRGVFDDEVEIITAFSKQHGTGDLVLEFSTNDTGNPYRERIVRCESCRYSHWYTEDDVEYILKCSRFFNMVITSKDFCSWGEARS